MMKSSFDYNLLSDTDLETCLSSNDISNNEKHDIKYFYNNKIPLFNMDRYGKIKIVSKDFLLNQMKNDKSNLCFAIFVLSFFSLILTAIFVSCLWILIFKGVETFFIVSAVVFFIFSASMIYSVVSDIKDLTYLKNKTDAINNTNVPATFDSCSLQIDLRYYKPLFP